MWQLIWICSGKILNTNICACAASKWVRVVTVCPYKPRVEAQEDIQNFFLQFDLDIHGFPQPELVRHPMELEVSLENRNKPFKYFEVSREMLYLWLEIVKRAVWAGGDLWKSCGPACGSLGLPELRLHRGELRTSPGRSFQNTLDYTLYNQWGNPSSSCPARASLRDFSTVWPASWPPSELARSCPGGPQSMQPSPGAILQVPLGWRQSIPQAAACARVPLLRNLLTDLDSLKTKSPW